MLFSKICTVAAPIEELWDFMIDARAVSACMPGLEEFNEVGPDEFEGRVRISIGPISLKLAGKVAVLERDQQNWICRMSAEAKDMRIAGDVKALFTTQLTRKGEDETEINITTEAKVLGKLGEFGQPIMKKTADRYLTRFIESIASALAQPSSAAH
jgi:carbon monoxide dehydrogenase subunit G